MTTRIPIAADGTQFDLANCCRSGGYRVGPKGKEHKFARFEDALATLNLMEKPFWRRPNSNSNWGIVTAATWL